MNGFKNPQWCEHKSTPKRMRKKITLWLRSYDVRSALSLEGISDEATFIPASTEKRPGYLPVVIWVDDEWAPPSSAEVRRMSYLIMSKESKDK